MCASSACAQIVQPGSKLKSFGSSRCPVQEATAPQAALERSAAVVQKCTSARQNLQKEKSLDYLLHIKYLLLEIKNGQLPRARGSPRAPGRMAVLSIDEPVMVKGRNELLDDLEREEGHEMFRLLSKSLHTLELSTTRCGMFASRKA